METLPSLVSVQEDGHALLLLEVVPGQRTFSDYPNLYLCLETIVNMYEEYREATNQHQDDGDLKDFMKWIDDFYRMELFTYVSEIGRYQNTPREGLKRLFETNDSGQYRPTQNGIKNNETTGGSSLNSCSLGDELIEDESSSDNWDD